MTLSLIVAMDENQVIGNQGELPWRLPNDLKYFQEKTTNSSSQYVIMGRKTFESLPAPLPNRINMVLSRGEVTIREKHKEFTPYIDIRHSVWEAMAATEEMTKGFGEDLEFFVIGGASIYDQFYKFADRLYVTHIDHAFEGDTKWEGIDWDDWTIISCEQGVRDEANPYDYSFAVYERKKG